MARILFCSARGIWSHFRSNSKIQTTAQSLCHDGDVQWQKEKIMKGIRTFNSQTEALKYFVGIIIEAANRGWFQTDEVKDLFRRELENWGTGSAESIRRGADSGADHCICEFWGLVCLPILNFFMGVVEGGDNSMSCDFRWDIPKPKRGQKVLMGKIAWYGTASPGRFIRIIFSGDGSAWMFYDTGYRHDREQGEDVPKGESSFLSLPANGDENLSDISREEFYLRAHPEANN